MATALTAEIDFRKLAGEVGLPGHKVEAVVALLDDGNTVPFITRYRKDQTGGLDEEPIRAIQAALARWRMVADRKQTILRSIDSQGKLTPELAAQIEAAESIKRLEDLYLPFKPKKQTLATVARQRGLEPLAEEVLAADPKCQDLDGRAADFVDPDRKLPHVADVLLGVGHIIAEGISERADLRGKLRGIFRKTGKIVSTRIGGPAAELETRPEGAKRSAPATVKQQFQQMELLLEDSTESDPDSGIEAEQVRQGDDSAAPADVKASQLSSGAEPPGIATGGRSVEPTSATDAPSSTDRAAASSPEVPSADARQAAGSAGQISDSTDAMLPEDSTETAVTKPTTSTTPSSEKSGNTVDPASHQTAEVKTPKEDAPADSNGPESLSATDTTGASQESRAATTSPQSAPKQSAAERKKAEKEKRAKAKREKQERKAKHYKDYFDFTEPIGAIPPHRLLAINRGEKERVLRVRIESDTEAMTRLAEELVVSADHPHADLLRGCVHDALARLIVPGLEREARREMTEKSEAHAVEVFARNLGSLLLQPPVRGRRLLAIDPGFKSGCKLAALDEFGNLLGHAIVYIVGKPQRIAEAKAKVVELVDTHNLSVIAVGNGTASRETEQLVADLIGSELAERGTRYVIVNEAGASVYSTSPLAREELPEYDATLRSAISIGRRLQDPLSELVKIDPGSIGVGLYQHDLKARHLQVSLDAVVESCVNYVGVDLNTASPALLRYVSGLNQLTARRLYEHRTTNGPFRTREQLKEVPGFGEATFVQAAGFLKIAGSDNPLDATWIHPESYDVAGRVLAQVGASPEDVARQRNTAKASSSGEAPAKSEPDAPSLTEKLSKLDAASLAGELGCGELLLHDIVCQLTRPGRDPREDLPPPIFKSGVLKLEDLEPGMELSGTVLNVVDFGAFVDIGLHDTGLVHVSHLANRFVKDPHEVVAVGDVVKVWVLSIDKDRRRVALTMVAPGTERPPRQRSPRRSSGADASQTSGGESSGGDRPQRTPRGRRDDRSGGAGRGRGGGRARSGQGRGGQGRGGKPRGGQPARPPKPKHVPPITDEMLKGQEPMRTFGDLAQFYSKRGDDKDQTQTSDDSSSDESAS